MISSSDLKLLSATRSRTHTQSVIVCISPICIPATISTKHTFAWPLRHLLAAFGHVSVSALFFLWMSARPLAEIINQESRMIRNRAEFIFTGLLHPSRGQLEESIEPSWVRLLNQSLEIDVCYASPLLCMRAALIN